MYTIRLESRISSIGGGRKAKAAKYEHSTNEKHLNINESPITCLSIPSSLSQN